MQATEPNSRPHVLTMSMDVEELGISHFVCVINKASGCRSMRAKLRISKPGGSSLGVFMHGSTNSL
jgi:hypothetical protein